MSQNFVINLAREALTFVMLIASPILILSLLVGLIISIFQATTQIQEQTLTFVPKILIVFVSIIVLGPWMLNALMDFTIGLFSNLSSFVK